MMLISLVAAEQLLFTTNTDYKFGEYLLPTIVGSLLHDGKAEVSVLSSKDKWFGVTYKEDKEIVIAAVRALVDAGVYPERLF